MNLELSGFIRQLKMCAVLCSGGPEHLAETLDTDGHQ